jgi:hypothetical protein
MHKINTYTKKHRNNTNAKDAQGGNVMGGVGKRLLT